MNQTLSSWWPHLLQAEENKEGDCGESPLLPLLQRHFAVADDDHGDGDDKYDDGVGDGVDDFGIYSMHFTAFMFGLFLSGSYFPSSLFCWKHRHQCISR